MDARVFTAVTAACVDDRTNTEDCCMQDTSDPYGGWGGEARPEPGAVGVAPTPAQAVSVPLPLPLPTPRSVDVGTTTSTSQADNAKPGLLGEAGSVRTPEVVDLEEALVAAFLHVWQECAVAMDAGRLAREQLAVVIPSEGRPPLPAHEVLMCMEYAMGHCTAAEKALAAVNTHLSGLADIVAADPSVDSNGELDTISATVATLVQQHLQLQGHMVYACSLFLKM
jgi:hypothetical protein